jgi:hypothetical protein
VTGPLKQRKESTFKNYLMLARHVIIAIQKAEISRITIQASPSIISKISNTKRAGEVAQVAECLSSKHEAWCNS